MKGLLYLLLIALIYLVFIKGVPVCIDKECHSIKIQIPEIKLGEVVVK